MKHILLITALALLLALPVHAMDQKPNQDQQTIHTLAEEIKQLYSQIESLEKQDAPQAHLDDLYAQLAAKKSTKEAHTKYEESLE
jgi:hypothetical protein